MQQINTYQLIYKYVYTYRNTYSTIKKYTHYPLYVKSASVHISATLNMYVKSAFLIVQIQSDAF